MPFLSRVNWACQDKETTDNINCWGKIQARRIRLVRLALLWWSRGGLNPLFEQIRWFYCALLPAFSYFFRTFSYRLVSTRDGFWRVKSTGKSTWGEKEKCTKLMFSMMWRHRGMRLCRGNNTRHSSHDAGWYCSIDNRRAWSVARLFWKREIGVSHASPKFRKDLRR